MRRPCNLSLPRVLTAIAALMATQFCAPTNAQTEPASIKAAATPTFAEWLVRADEIKWQDDAVPLYDAARIYATQGEHDQAIALWQKALQIPAAPGAHPPGMMPGPRDYRGWARWGIAESLRAQQKWSEALAMYRHNREKSPLDDGCVQLGAAAQRMAIAEGICLENLGRHDEAVQLYVQATRYVGEGVPPIALRRLLDLYASAGQLADLDALMALETAGVRRRAREIFDGDATRALDADEQRQVEDRLSFSFVPAWKRERALRIAAREQKWAPLIEAIGAKPQTGDATADAYRRDAFVLLAQTPELLEFALQRALQSDPESIWLQVALHYHRADATERARMRDGAPQSELENHVRELPIQPDEPTDFPPIPENLRLPGKIAQDDAQ